MKILCTTLLFITSWVIAQETADYLPIEKYPEVIEFVDAVYPEDAIKKGLEGTVSMEVIISAQGIVDSITLIKGINSQLDTAAMSAVKKILFSPAVAGGVAIPVAIEYGYTFSLESITQSIQEYTNFKGRLREKGTKNPIANAIVIATVNNTIADTLLAVPLELYLQTIGRFEGQAFEEGALVTETDSLGYFSFKSLPTCSITVKFHSIGYTPASSIEQVQARTLIDMDYRLARDDSNEYEIVVYGSIEKKEVSQVTLSMDEVKRVPGTGGDAIKVVRALPGVSRPSFISGEVLFRGSGPEDSRFYIDGVELPRLFHFGGLRSTYNSDLLSSIDMYPGGFGARYGGAIGGVVEIKGRKAQTDRWHGLIDLNVIDAGGRIEGPLSSNLSVQIAGRYSYIGKIIEQMTKNEQNSVVPIYWDGLMRLDWEISKNNSAFFTYNTSTDALEIKIASMRGGSDELTDDTETSTLVDRYHMGIAGLNSRINDHLTNELRVSGTYMNGNGSAFGLMQYKYEGYTGYIRNEFQCTAIPKTTVMPGLDITLRKYIYEFKMMTESGIHSADDSMNMSEYGSYLNIKIDLFSNFWILPGIRYDYFEGLNTGKTSYRIATRFEYIDGFALKGAAGTYSQIPKPMGLALMDGLGNSTLPLSTAQHIVIGHEWQGTDELSLDVQAYYNTQHSIPNGTDSINPVTSESINFLPEQEGRMYGLEILLKHDKGRRFFGWVSYSLSRSEIKSPNPFAEELLTTSEIWDPNKWTVAPHDQTHNVQLVGSWRLPSNWETGFRLRYVTGNPQTPLKSFEENEFSFDSEVLAYKDVPGDPFTDRMDAFIQLDLRVDKKFVFNDWILSTYLDCQNVNYFFYNSPELYEYNYDKSKREPVGALFVPSLGITAQF